ncbi:MAG: hypothetical protein WCY77_03585 [Weeksellaceae bacterium]
MIKKTIIPILFLTFLNSCFVNTPSYHVSGTNELFTKNPNQSKWIVYFGEGSYGAEHEVKTQIIADFQELFPEKIEFIHQSLSIDNDEFTRDKMNEEDLEDIREETNSEILMVFKIQMKYQTQDQLFSIKKVTDEKYRNMFIFLDVYDLHTKKLLYTKYSFSQLKIGDSGDFIAKTGIKTQALKTYEKLKNDFIKFIHPKE